MRTREQLRDDLIRACGKKDDMEQSLILLEVFLDIRDLMSKE